MRKDLESIVVNLIENSTVEQSNMNGEPAEKNDKPSYVLDEDSDDRYRGVPNWANHPRMEMRMFWPNGDLREHAQRLEQLARDLRAITAGDLRIDDITRVELADWRLTYRRVLSLTGVSIDHPTLGNKTIHTSEVYFIDLDRGIARTLSRWYRLTTPFTPPAPMSEH